MQDKIYQYLIQLGDNSMILGHRLSELCGHGPTLETDIALTNISLDLFGQVRHYFQYAAKISGGDKTEDDIAFLRYVHEYKNCLLVEQPNTDFAHIIVRQFYYDVYHLHLLQALTASTDKQISAIANKSLKEVKYHSRFSTQWLKRLGDGTEESHSKMQVAVDYLQPYTTELFESTPVEDELYELGITADLRQIKEQWLSQVKDTLNMATLTYPDNEFGHSGGKKGIHTEHLGYILSDLQYMQRAYPNMNW